MSSIAAEWIDTKGSRKTEAVPVELPREIEFRRALDHYMRGYREQNRPGFAGKPKLLRTILNSLRDQ